MLTTVLMGADRLPLPGSRDLFGRLWNLCGPGLWLQLLFKVKGGAWPARLVDYLPSKLSRLHLVGYAEQRRWNTTHRFWTRWMRNPTVYQPVGHVVSIRR